MISATAPYDECRHLPDENFLSTLRHELATAEAHIVSFANFLIDGDSRSTIYVTTTTAD
jgi:hypothetical protein